MRLYILLNNEGFDDSGNDLESYAGITTIPQIANLWQANDMGYFVEIEDINNGQTSLDLDGRSKFIKLLKRLGLDNLI